MTTTTRRGFDVEGTIEKIKSQTTKRIWVFGLGGAFLLAGGGYWVAWALMGAAAAMGAALIAGILGSIGLFGAKPFFQWLQVKQIALTQAIAANNPIATQWALWEKEENKINATKATLDEYSAGINSYDLQINDSKDTLSPERYQERKTEVAMMKADLGNNREILKVQEQDLNKWERLILELEADWNLSITRDKLNEKLLGLKRQEMTDRIKNNASLSAVRDSIAKRRAQIESSLADSQARAERAGVPVVQIPLTPTETLEIPVTQNQKVEVQK